MRRNQRTRRWVGTALFETVGLVRRAHRRCDEPIMHEKVRLLALIPGPDSTRVRPRPE